MNLIQIISDTAPSGALRYALDLGHALEQRGHSVATILRKGHPELEPPFRRAALAVGYLPLRGALDFISPTILSRILDRVEQPVVIHTHSLSDALTALRARNLMKSDGSGVKIVHSVRSAVPPKTSRVERNTLRRLDDIIFPSEASRRAYLSVLPDDLLKGVRIHTLPPCSDVPACTARPERANDAVTNFVYVGSLVPEKGFDLLVEAIGIVEARRPGRARYTILGSGNSRAVMPAVRRSRALGVDHKIEWKGHVDDIYPYLCEADAGIVPSRAPEASALTPVEFMSQGLPVIATREGGALESFVRHGEDGLLVSPDSAAELADAMLKIIDSPSLGREMGDAGRRRVSAQASYPAFVDAILEIYGAPRQNP
ncbi:MAG: glycosyltransferase family 4 protein [Muribaculaceae bacterium]|nr:glycosyltransferase family 4 protein [Muribaculaceae bacterium]